MESESDGIGVDFVCFGGARRSYVPEPGDLFVDPADTAQCVDHGAASMAVAERRGFGEAYRSNPADDTEVNRNR